MSKIKFEKAMLLIEGEFIDQLSWWPEWFPPVNLAVLQAPLKDEVSAWQAAIESAVKTGELASTPKPYLWRPLIFDLSKDFTEQEIPCFQDTVTAPDFAAWLTTQGEKPSEFIAAWFDSAQAGKVNGMATAKPATMVGTASDAPATQSYFMKLAALIAELKYEWPSIKADIKEATRNGLNAAAHTRKHGEWDRDKARAWAVSKGKIKQAVPVHSLAAVWPGTVTRRTINR